MQAVSWACNRPNVHIKLWVLSILTTGIMGIIGYSILLGLYWDNGKGNGNYHLGFRVLEGAFARFSLELPGCC